MKLIKNEDDYIKAKKRLLELTLSAEGTPDYDEMELLSLLINVYEDQGYDNDDDDTDYVDDEEYEEYVENMENLCNELLILYTTEYDLKDSKYTPKPTDYSCASISGLFYYLQREDDVIMINTEKRLIVMQPKNFISCVVSEDEEVIKMITKEEFENMLRKVSFEMGLTDYFISK